MSSNPEIYERVYIVKIFHSKDLQVKEIPQLLPEVFVDNRKRLVAYIMKKLFESGVEISINNILLFYKSNNDNLHEFLKKHKVNEMQEDDFQNILFDTEAHESSDKLFDFACNQTKAEAFGRYVEEAAETIKYYGSYKNFPLAVGKAKGIVTWYNTLFNPNKTTAESQLRKAMQYINEDNEYVRTSSQRINTLIGGWTRGYPATVAAKSSHNKSTYLTFDSVHGILSGKVPTTDIISTEESAEIYWRRIYAEICGLSTSGMRQKNAKVTMEHVKLVESKLGDKLKIYDGITKYRDVLDIMDTTKSSKIVVDHLQSIPYPGNGTFMANMIGNIPGLIDYEKKIAKQKHIPIINLTQVNDKVIDGSDRMVKAPKIGDAYGSSVLRQASREFLCLYYPYKDWLENPYDFDEAPSINDFYVNVEKSSFSSTGGVKMYYDPERATFQDSQARHTEKGDYVAGKEKPIDELTLFDKEKKKR